MTIDAELSAAVERMLELLERIATALERLQAQGEQIIELQRSLDRSQYS